MVTEFRQIVFPMPVLRQALDAARFSSGRDCYRLPSGTIVGVKLDEQVTLLIEPPEGGEPLVRSLSAAETGAAMIRWCLAHRVPLPKGGNKRLSSVAGHLCLEVYLPGGIDPLPAETLGAGLPWRSALPVDAGRGLRPARGS